MLAGEHSQERQAWVRWNHQAGRQSRGQLATKANLCMTENGMVAAPNKTGLSISGDSITLKSVLSQLIFAGHSLTLRLVQKADPALPTDGGRRH
jgi:hypothetical protein